MSTAAIENDTLTEIPDIPGLSIQSPLDGDYTVTQAFGVRSVTGILHRGIDQSCGAGTPVRAVKDGMVSFTYTEGRDMPGLESDGSPGGYGSQVRIDHEGMVESRYAHFWVVYVTAGQQVVAGQTLGLSGSTGISSGPHLHWELRWGDTPFDPAPYIGKEIDDVLPEDRALLDWVAANKGLLAPLAFAARDAGFDAAHDTSATNDAVSRGIRRVTKLLKGMQLTEAQLEAMSAGELRDLVRDTINVEVPS